MKNRKTIENYTGYTKIIGKESGLVFLFLFLNYLVLFFFVCLVFFFASRVDMIVLLVYNSVCQQGFGRLC